MKEALHRLEHECLITAERESELCKDIELVCAAYRALATASSPSEDTKRLREEFSLDVHVGKIARLYQSSAPNPDNL